MNSLTESLAGLNIQNKENGKVIIVVRETEKGVGQSFRARYSPARTRHR